MVFLRAYMNKHLELLHYDLWQPKSRPLFIFILFLAANTLKVVLASLYIDRIQAFFPLICVIYLEYFILAFLLFGTSIITGEYLPLVVFYLLQSLYLLVNVYYLYLFNNPIHLNYYYKLCWEFLTVGSTVTIGPTFFFGLLAIVDLPLFIAVIKNSHRLKSLFRWPLKTMGYFFAAAIFSLAALIAATELTAVPRLNYSNPRASENDIYVLHRYGLLAHNIIDLILWKSEKRELLALHYGPESAVQHIRDSFPNVIMIQVESLDANVIDFTWKGQYIAPYLHQLSRSCIYYPYTVSYHMAGGSSDCEVAVLSSVEPLSDMPIMSSQSYEYPNSVVKEFRRNGFTATAFHGNTGDFFNRDHAYYKMGFNRFYDRLRMRLHEQGWGAADEEVFTFAKNKLGQSNRPFFDYIITMSSHEPFTNIKHYYRTNQFDDVTPELARNYLMSINYVDHTLRSFVTQALNEYPDTYVFIYGDHTPYAINSGPFHRAHILLDDKDFEFVPLLILTPRGDVKYESEKSASFLDIAPTALAASGITYHLNTYGENLMTPLHREIPFRGNFYSREILYHEAKITAD